MLSFDPRGNVPARTMATTFFIQPGSNTDIEVPVPFGTEKQARLPGQPRHNWASGALWARWELGKRWSLAFRPEFFWDPEGQITQARQSIQAYTGTVKYRLSTKSMRLEATLEARYDRSTGDEGGFYAGADNELVPGQSLILFGVLCSFEP